MMLWIITKDLSDTKCEGLMAAGSRARRAAWDGAPAEAKQAIRQTWIDLCDTEFRLLDDDDNVCYEGVCHQLDDQDGDSAFEPLDWAEQMVGATEMQYRKKGAAVWKTL